LRRNYSRQNSSTCHSHHRARDKTKSDCTETQFRRSNAPSSKVALILDRPEGTTSELSEDSGNAISDFQFVLIPEDLQKGGSESGGFKRVEAHGDRNSMVSGIAERDIEH